MERNKKIKAAIAGVLQFLKQEEERSKQKKTNQWIFSGRKMIMLNNILVQRREFDR